MVYMRQAWKKQDEKKQDEMRKHEMRKGGKKKVDRMKAWRKDDTMMVGKMDKMFVEFLKISLVGRRKDEKLSVFRFSSANFDPPGKRSTYFQIEVKALFYSFLGPFG